METGQAFTLFQTTFLYLAGEGQIPQESYRLDLFDKLPTYLQRMLLLVLDDLETYEKLVARCLTLDTDLRRIEDLNTRKRSIKSKSQSTTPSPIPTRTIRSPSTVPPRLLTPAPENRYRSSISPEPSIIYYNY